jgi:hypothetical protein
MSSSGVGGLAAADVAGQNFQFALALYLIDFSHLVDFFLRAAPGKAGIFAFGQGAAGRFGDVVIRTYCKTSCEDSNSSTARNTMRMGGPSPPLEKGDFGGFRKAI